FRGPRLYLDLLFARLRCFSFLILRRPARPTLFPYTTLFRSCELAAAINAEVIVVEKNYGGDMARNVIRSAWDALARERSQDGRFTGLAPQVKLVTAKRGKLLRAEPVAQQLVEDRVRLGAALPELEEEWASWQPTDPDSPGRIDASCYLVYAVLPVPGAEAVVSSPTGVPRSLAVRGSGVRIQRRRV